MSTYEDDGPDFGEDDTELDVSGLDDDEPLSLDDEDDDFSEED
jgi:hypothetical protein